MQILLLDPQDLKLHSAVKALPCRAGNDYPELNALIEDIRDRGIQQPLLVDPEHRILDGRERWKAAKALQLREIPVIIRPANESLATILHGLVQGKHYTKGALAYLSFPLFEKVIEENRQRRISALKNAKTPMNPRQSIESTYEGTVDGFAKFLGFRRDLFFQAKQLHELFSDSDQACAAFDVEHPHEGPLSSARPIDLRARFEQLILNGEIGLGAAIAGIAGLDATKGKERPEPAQLELFEEAFETIEIRACRDWSKFDEITKRKLGHKIKEVFLKLPDEVVDLVAKAIKAREREAKS